MQNDNKKKKEKKTGPAKHHPVWLVELCVLSVLVLGPQLLVPYGAFLDQREQKFVVEGFAGFFFYTADEISQVT